MFAFLRTAFSTKALRPFTAQHQHQPSALANALGANSTEAVRGMKVRSSVKLMCDHCNLSGDVGASLLCAAMIPSTSSARD
ncbi:hypothetical protein BX661DRAFT_177350, partial [Kickxella alabastrina]|uniref:uncharacterized protein n=1 Tax=Kickxella alabastrina TaxID=61397 RepID=UPI00221F4A97